LGTDEKNKGNKEGKHSGAHKCETGEASVLIFGLYSREKEEGKPNARVPGKGKTTNLRKGRTSTRFGGSNSAQSTSVRLHEGALGITLDNVTGVTCLIGWQQGTGASAAYGRIGGENKRT